MNKTAKADRRLLLRHMRGQDIKMNLQTLAKLANVSVSTVSKAFSGSSEISEKTREHIFRIAKEHHCFDHYNKNKFSKKVIAVISPEAQSDYYNKMLMLLGSQIEQSGGIMTVSFSNFSDERTIELFQYYSSYCHVDGIIIIGSAQGIDNRFHFPCVSIGGTSKCSNIDSIALDNLPAFRDAVLHLKNLGHRIIGFAGEQLTQGSCRLFRQAMTDCALFVSDKYILESTERFEQAGMSMGQEFLSMSDPPTAIFAAYDYIAIGLIKALKQGGCRVPEDISVIGTNDIAMLPYLDIPLSTIRTHSEDACKMAVDLILKKIKNCYYSPREQLTVQADFVARSSSGICRKNIP